MLAIAVMPSTSPWVFRSSGTRAIPVRALAAASSARGATPSTASHLDCRARTRQGNGAARSVPTRPSRRSRRSRPGAPRCRYCPARRAARRRSPQEAAALPCAGIGGWTALDQIVADHGAYELALGPVGARRGPRHLAVPEDGDRIGDFKHLIEIVADEHHRGTVVPSSRMLANSDARSGGASAVVGSSKRMRRASDWMPRMISSICWSATDSRRASLPAEWTP